MTSFYTATAIYLGISLLFVAAIFAMGIQSRRTFASRFGKGRQPDDLDETEEQDWNRIHAAKFDSGFWRWVTVGFMFYHYPGFVLSVIVARGRGLNTLIVFFGAAIIWISILYFVFGP